MFRATSRLLCNDIHSQLSLFRKDLAAGGPSLAVISLMKEARTRDQAAKVMDLAKEKNIITKPLYDSYLGCLADLRLVDLVKEGLAKMLESQIIPDEKSYSNLVKAHLENGTHVGDIEYLTDKLANNGAMGNHGYFEVIRHYCKVGHLELAMKFYNKMIKLHITPSNAIFNELIRAYANTPQGCKGMFDEMRKKGVEPTEETYEVLARVFQTDADTCKGLYSGMAKRGILMNANIAGDMITAFGMVQNWEWCKKVWDDLIAAERKPRTATYLAMMTYYIHSGDYATMLQVFDALKLTKLVEKHIVNTSLINTYVNMGEYGKCMEIYAEMKKDNSAISVEGYENLMVASAKLKDAKLALSFERALKENKKIPKRESLHVLLGCLAHHSEEKVITRILQSMHFSGVAPNYDTYLALFEGARGPTGSVMVRRLLREMEEETDVGHDAEADAMRVYLEALSMCARAKDSQGALEVFHSLLAHSRDSFITKQRQTIPSQAFDIVLSSCANAGNLVVCKKILEHTRKEKLKFHPDTYNTLLEGFGKIGDLPECRKIAEEMKEQGIELDLSTGARAAIRPLSGGGGLFNTLLDEMEEEEVEEENKQKK